MDVIMEREASEFTPLFSRSSINFTGEIDDSNTLSTSTWSSQKIANEIAAGNAGNVKYNVEQSGLTETEKSRARTNIGAAAQAALNSLQVTVGTKASNADLNALSNTVANSMTNKANTTLIARAYTTGVRFNTGDLCTYQGQLYRCTETQTSAPATFDPTKWTAVTVEEAMQLATTKATTAQVQAIISDYVAT